MINTELPLLFPRACNLKKLDLQFTFLSAENHYELLHLHTNLEVLEVRNVIRDRGLSMIAQGCLNMEFIAIHVISNLALEAVGEYCKNLRDFRLVFLDKEERITDLPLDNGVMALLLGCSLHSSTFFFSSTHTTTPFHSTFHTLFSLATSHFPQLPAHTRFPQLILVSVANPGFRSCFVKI